jgi:TonB family protein
MNTRILFFLLLFSQMAFAQVAESSSDTVIVSTAEIVAEFNGGLDALSQYISTNLETVSNPKKKKASAREDFVSNPKKKKASAREDLFEGGRVVVRFVIEKDGTVSNVYLEERLRKCEPCNREAVRVVQDMPKWNPAYKNGNPVRMYFRLPIRFVVD